MLTTEKEAREKWCPEARITRSHALTHLRPATGDDLVLIGGCNRDPLGKEPDPIWSCRCIASACMMWRWVDARPNPERVGFCGLAGEPREANLIAELIGSLQITIQNALQRQ